MNEVSDHPFGTSLVRYHRHVVTPFRHTVLAGFLHAGAACAHAGTAVGDRGHFLSYTPTVHLWNPQGAAATMSVHVMQRPMPEWQRASVSLRLVAPDGSVLADGEHALNGSTATLAIPAGSPGVYRLHTTDNVWGESTLERAVGWTGIPGVHLMDDEPVPGGSKSRKREHYEKRGHLVFQASVPRRWWFWVPPDVTSFRCRAMRADRCMSQREDWGFFVISPRGQRVRALWGQPPHAGAYRQEQSVNVEVEPGAAGRFWCLEVGLGNSHHFVKINIALEGVPPYLVRSPEEWFDPCTGSVPETDPYDNTPFIQSALLPGMRERRPCLQHFSPCPFLGDPDGIEVLGDARFAIWNPEGHDLAFRIGTYLPRGGTKAEPALAHVRIAAAEDGSLLDRLMEMRHLHDQHGHPADRIAGKGVLWGEVAGVERWMAFTYPATPLVLVGEPDEEGWRFRFTACAARNWYFFVPAGTREIGLQVAADLPTDVLHVELCPPDRVMAVIYGNSGAQAVRVPDGLDGKVWHLRPSVGSATRMLTTEPPYRYQNIGLTLRLKGAPGCLAPTWEQWFDPSKPAAARDRDRAGGMPR